MADMPFLKLKSAGECRAPAIGGTPIAPGATSASASGAVAAAIPHVRTRGGSRPEKPRAGSAR
jgi:hypothetical protein